MKRTADKLENIILFIHIILVMIGIISAILLFILFLGDKTYLTFLIIDVIFLLLEWPMYAIMTLLVNTLNKLNCAADKYLELHEENENQADGLKG